MGDIHGNFRAFMQCIERSGFNPEKDLLIQLGDVTDRGSHSYECVEYLISLSNLIHIKGNHDDWTLTMLNTGIHPGLHQGGRATLESYLRHCDEGSFMNDYRLFVPESHLKFFRTQYNYYILDRKLFVHGGFNRHELINEQHQPDIYYWDRDLWASAMSYQSMRKKHSDKESWVGKFKYKDTSFDEVFIGHTSTTNWSLNETYTQSGVVVPGNVPCTIPMVAANIINVDTGGGNPEGKLTIMDIDTKQYWQSDIISSLEN